MDTINQLIASENQEKTQLWDCCQSMFFRQFKAVRSPAHYIFTLLQNNLY